MLTEVTIPKLTITMEGGTVLRWLKEEGMPVAKDEVLLELETDKAVTEVPSPADGILRAILVSEGEVQVGAVVGFVGDLSDPLPESATPHRPSESKAGPSRPVPPSPRQSFATKLVLRATPAAKRRAKELGVDIALVEATGPEGRITQEDVERAATRFAEKGSELTPAGSLRPIIAEHVSLAWRVVPHIHIGGELRATGLRQALEKVRRDLSAEVSVTDLLLYSVAALLPKFPALNTVWQNDKPVPQEKIRLAFAVRTERGVVAPVLQFVDPLTLQAVSDERKRLREAVHFRGLRPNDLEGGTFTVTNLGMFPVDFFAPIINYPQSAILATGRIRDRVEFRDGSPVTVSSIWANLAVDHRVADGAEAAEFLGELEKTFDSLEECLV
jgi:pyruvate dehydrogenase E2 component (dihydrolipoyllysine-residue acetyltransferase)